MLAKIVLYSAMATAIIASAEEKTHGRCTTCGNPVVDTPKDIFLPIFGGGGILIAIPILVLQIITLILVGIILKKEKEYYDTTGGYEQDYSGYSSYRSLYPSHETLGMMSQFVNNAIDAYNSIDTN